MTTFHDPELPGNELTADECETLGLDPTLRVRGKAWLWTDVEVQAAARLFVRRAALDIVREVSLGPVVNPDGTPTSATLAMFGRSDVEFVVMREFLNRYGEGAEMWHTGGNVWVVRWAVCSEWGVDRWVDTVEAMASPGGDDGSWLVSIELYDKLDETRTLVEGYNFSSDVASGDISGAVEFAQDCVEWYETMGTQPFDGIRHIVGQPTKF